MAKLLLGALAFCHLAIYANANSNAQAEEFEIHGHVYCDPCRLEFKTNFSYPLDGIKLKVKCKNRDNGTTTFTTETKSRADGFFAVKVPGDHEDDTCAVILTTPNQYPQCTEVSGNQDRDTVSITNHAGEAGNIRYTNDLFYMTKDVDNRCDSIYKSLYDEANEDY